MGGITTNHHNCGIPFPEDEYLIKIGQIAYGVSYLEWAILGDLPHLQELADAGCDGDELLKQLAGLTTHAIAQKLQKTSEQITDAKLLSWMQEGIDSLNAIFQLRNQTLHARPATIGGKRRLYRYIKNESFPIDDSYVDETLEKISSAVAKLNAKRVLPTP